MYIFSENSEELNLPGYFASLNILKADLQSVNLMLTLVETNLYFTLWKAASQSLVARSFLGGHRGRVVKVADVNALDHSIISPLWVRASLGPKFTCETSQSLLAGVLGGFPRVLRFSPHLLIGPSHMS